MGRREQILKQACEKLNADGIPAIYFAGDVRKYEACEAAVQAVLKQYNQLNIRALYLFLLLRPLAKLNTNI